MAGIMPLMVPTTIRMAVATTTIVGEMSRRMSAASALLAIGAVEGDAADAIWLTV